MHKAARYTTAEVADLLDSVLAVVDHAQRKELSQTELVALMQRLRRARDKVDALASVVTAEVSGRRATESVLGTPLASVMAVDEGLDIRDAAAELFDAARVNSNEVVRDKALDGELSRKHASAIGRGMASLPAGLTKEQDRAAQQAFIRYASEGLSPRRLQAMGPTVLAEVAPDVVPTREDSVSAAEARRERAVQKRSFNWGDDGDGSVWFRGSLPELEAQPLIRMVEGYVESGRRAARADADGLKSVGADVRVQRERRRAEAEITPDQRRADGLIRLVEDHRGAPASAGDRPRLVVTIAEKDLRQGALEAGLLPNGNPLSAGELRRAVCDAGLMPVVLGGGSEILDVGTERRLVTPEIRRALSMRDGGCIFPNCQRSDAGCEAHHVVPWWAGGPTSLQNLVLVCPHHHKLLEPNRFGRGDRWSVTFEPGTGKPRAVPPDRMKRYREHGRGGPQTHPPDPTNPTDAKPPPTRPDPAHPFGPPDPPDPTDPPTRPDPAHPFGPPDPPDPTDPPTHGTHRTPDG
ncbi:HNH endonuclease [Tessaracoccus sp. OS52]|uniref:HNH endonuclease signature motif containing protein n=1 Tax=Tessaracoccus sp. OS52 TaxID=2886691 RepID=UPI001D0FA6FA|nr:HNH endonuclease signature motif containing protein [Tessaracoccus sp. OS52]MCC2594203.1 HNH endonuclease [Tessaracoccus sp. OS52]